MQASWVFSSITNFNPRTHKECDNFTRLSCHLFKNFNPRTHKECDHNSKAKSTNKSVISIHALTKSATLQSVICVSYFLISIHALTKSATGDTWHSIARRHDFNPRTHKECDFTASTVKGSKQKFQSTHSQRVRHLLLLFLYGGIIFQSTHSQRVRLSSDHLRIYAN